VTETGSAQPVMFRTQPVWKRYVQSRNELYELPGV